ncbi:MAG: D-Ala-D-Ala carboxypeptidase family metallohydrolase [Hyphomonas sp.]|nr:D-Ala-D-Ala carboxypeptidase family metallohydrolase [Hyphomonas sp.]
MFQTSSSAQSALSGVWRWPNFRISELACRCDGRFCAGAYWHAPDFLDRLQKLRDLCGRPLRVSSGHRCPQWNAAVGGAPLSRHKQIAVDILIHEHDRAALKAQAEAVGFTGFGLARHFIHLDLRARRTVWYYSGSKHLWQS